MNAGQFVVLRVGLNFVLSCFQARGRCSWWTTSCRYETECCGSEATGMCMCVMCCIQVCCVTRTYVYPLRQLVCNVYIYLSFL